MIREKTIQHAVLKNHKKYVLEHQQERNIDDNLN